MKNDIMVTRTSMPDFDEYIEMIKPLWDTKWLTNMGKHHSMLENSLKKYLQVPNLSLTVNGHMALELIIQAMNFIEGGEIITTPFTFISTTHAIIRNKLTPVFCDIKLSDFTIDEEKIEELITEKTVAILPVHIFGNICNVEKIQDIANKHGLKVIYDAAHAFSETYKGIGVGNFGDATIFSFHATKVFNTIEGGAVAFTENELYGRLYNLKNFGIVSEESVVEVGSNAKMNEFCAAMGLCNLKHINHNIDSRKQRVAYYCDKLKDVKEVNLPEYRKDISYSYGYFPILFDSQLCGLDIRDKIYECLRKEQIFSRKYFYPITADQKCFNEKYKMLPLYTARYVAQNILALPLSPELDYSIIDKIVGLIKELVKQ